MAQKSTFFIDLFECVKLGGNFLQYEVVPSDLPFLHQLIEKVKRAREDTQSSDGEV